MPAYPPDQVAGLIAALEQVDGTAGFTKLVETRPELFAEEVEQALVAMQELESAASAVRPIERLVRDARQDPVRAWEEYEQSKHEAKETMGPVMAALDQIERLIPEHRWDEIIVLVENVRPAARSVGAIFEHAQLTRHAGVAHLYLAASRPELRVKAIELLQEALELLPPPAFADAQATMLASDLLINLSVAYGDDPSLDPQEAIEGCIETLNSALTYIDHSIEPEKWATAHTNLSRAYRRREQGNVHDNLTLSVKVARQALSVRSPQVDADAWVYSQLNLADALSALEAAGPGSAHEAEEAFQEVIAHTDSITQRWTVAGAHQGLASRILRSARERREQDDEVGAARIAAPAGEHLREAVALTEGDAPNAIRGRALMQLGSFEAEWGEAELAVSLQTEAVDQLFPGVPHFAREASRALGDLHAEAGRWPEAADAFRKAVQAAHVAFHARLYEAGRDRERGEMLNLGRFAAYALARAGDPEEAVCVLEDLRALEYRRRVGAAQPDLELVASQSPDLHAEYLSALADLRSQPLTGVDEAVSRRIQLTLEAIRALPGLQYFGSRARLQDLADAVAPRSPLLYIDPTPYGTALLAVTSDLSVRAFLLAETGREMFYRLAFGMYEEALGGVHPDLLPASYLATVSNDHRDVADSLDYILDWLGEHLVRDIAAALSGLDAAAVTLVPCGPVSAAPLHVSRWSGGHCLLDHFTVRFAPSGIVAAEAVRQAGVCAPLARRLVAAGNPKRNLPAAEAEVEEIAAMFAYASVRKGKDASADFLLNEGPAASAVHLACHARAGILDVSSTAIELADRDVTLAELALNRFDARLIVASACKTALPEIDSDEAISVAGALLMGGAPSAIATLWSVDDFPTAVLMTRLYELMLCEDRQPADALRESQLWLRRVPVSELEIWLNRHRKLRRLYRRLRRGGRLAGRFDGSRDTAPYSEEVHWAAFVVHGA